MITEFKENEARKSGIMYRSTLTQIKQLYEVDPIQAGEFAISAIELLLTGEISSDDAMINVILAQNKEINEKNANGYDLKVEQAKQRKIIDQKLEEIANLFMSKKTQKEIAVKLGLSQQTVSNRIALIRKEYPELLQEKNACTSNSEFVQVGTNVVQEKRVVKDEKSCTSKKELVQDGTSILKEFNF
jgi:DNA-directed RNA polymerase specialized sigma subunit